MNEGFAAVVALALLAVAGCGRPGTPASAAPSRQPEEPGLRTQLTEAEERRVEAAFRELAQGHEPTPLSRRVRMSDVPNAAARAADDAEAAIVRTTRTPAGGYVFELRTIEDWPGLLTVEPTPEGVYAATARIGRFPDWPERRARADRLLTAFHTWMKRYGAKRSIRDE